MARGDRKNEYTSCSLAKPAERSTSATTMLCLCVDEKSEAPSPSVLQSFFTRDADGAGCLPTMASAGGTKPQKWDLHPKRSKLCVPKSEAVTSILIQSTVARVLPYRLDGLVVLSCVERTAATIGGHGNGGQVGTGTAKPFVFSKLAGRSRALVSPLRLAGDMLLW